MTRLAERTWRHERFQWGLAPAELENLWSEDGPWHDEPDKVQWIDEATDLDCLAVRSDTFGAWCGYVGLPPGHPWHGIDKATANQLVTCHGCINFADACDEGAPEGHGVCHVPLPGRPADVWWIGFDCGHSFDLGPRTLYLPKFFRSGQRPGQYRTLEYVQNEVANLAEQCAKAAR